MVQTYLPSLRNSLVSLMYPQSPIVQLLTHIAWSRVFKAKLKPRSNGQSTVLEVRKGWWGEASILTSDNQEIARITTKSASCLSICAGKPSVSLSLGLSYSQCSC